MEMGKPGDPAAIHGLTNVSSPRESEGATSEIGQTRGQVSAVANAVPASAPIYVAV